MKFGSRLPAAVRLWLLALHGRGARQGFDGRFAVSLLPKSCRLWKRRGAREHGSRNRQGRHDPFYSTVDQLECEIVMRLFQVVEPGRLLVLKVVELRGNLRHLVFQFVILHGQPNEPGYLKGAYDRECNQSVFHRAVILTFRLARFCGHLFRNAMA